jgi:hypothetical protein
MQHLPSHPSGESRESSKCGPYERKRIVTPTKRSRMQYLTDGIHLYEIADMRTVQTYGSARGTIRYIILRDCVSEATAMVDELQLAALSPVR